MSDVQVMPNNPFQVNGGLQRVENNNPMVQVASSRQAQEVQGMMVLAKKFPRNQEEAYNRIMQACSRKGLAEVSQYSYPKGGQQVNGPSIRLAEALAQNWGNIDFGVVELEQRNGESTMMAYCVDLETNTRQTKIFQVPHEIHKKDGTVKKLTDPRDIYELSANQGARRLRACILGVIPGDIIDAATEKCDATLQGDGKVPLIDRIRIMSQKFAEEFQVSIPMLEKRLGHKLDSTNEQELVNLRKVYTSLRDGYAKREDFFDFVDSVSSPSGLSSSEPKTTDTPPQTQSEQRQAPGAPASPSVPNETLGASKPRGRKKDTEPQPESNPKEQYLVTLREFMERDGVSESEVVKVLMNAGALTTPDLNFATTNLLRDLTTEAKWNALLVEIGNL